MLVDSMLKYDDFTDQSGVRIMDTLIWTRRHFRPWELCEILVRMMHLLSADPRDRIFGMLRLLEQHPGRSRIIPDYGVLPIQLAVDLILGSHFRDIDEILVLVKALKLSPEQVATFQSHVTGAQEQTHECCTFVHSASIIESHQGRLYIGGLQIVTLLTTAWFSDQERTLMMAAMSKSSTSMAPLRWQIQPLRRATSS